MTVTELQKQQQADLYKNIWNVCCDFWGKMAGDDYKGYVLGLLFFRYLSERVEKKVAILLSEDGISYEEAWADEDYKEALIEELKEQLGYVIAPKYLYSKMLDMIEKKDKTFDIEYLQNAINDMMESTMGCESQNAFDGIFEDMDLYSSKLGKSVSDRSDLIALAITKIGHISFDFEDKAIDVIGDAYEYLIGQFAASAGKKSGSFYTPYMVDELIARITTIDRTDVLNVFDACGGSGSLELAVGRHSNVRNYYYQELTTTTYNLARMNMLLHGVNYSSMHLANDNTLLHPAYLDVPMDVVVSNPPYSQNHTMDDSFLDDPRFSDYGVLAPKSKADYAFLLSMLHTLKDDGVMAIVLPHGVLFRGAAEGKIRQGLLEKNYIDAVIGLAPNVFFGTTIPTVIVILRKNKKIDDVLFIDASKCFEAGKARNYLREEDVELIVETYKERKDVEKFAHVASMDEIRGNDYNLNIPRYVDTFEKEPEVELDSVFSDLQERNVKNIELDNKLNKFFEELGLVVKL